MVANLRYKVYSNTGEYIAACKFPDEAAAIVAMRGDGWTIRDGHRFVCWKEGSESQAAAESYDFVCETVYKREWRIP